VAPHLTHAPESRPELAHLYARPNRLMTALEVSRELGRSERTVRRWWHSGELPALALPCGRFTMRACELARWILARERVARGRNA